MAEDFYAVLGVPKTADDVGERISLAFRVRPDRPARKSGGGHYR